MKKDGTSLWAVALAAVAFAGLLTAFGLSVFSFRANVEQWARRDLRTRAELAAEGLRKPLATQDFRKLDEIAGRLSANEMILRVRSARGGWIFHGGYKGPTIEESVPCGEYRVGVALPADDVMKPFYTALAGFALAVLVGVCAMGVVFFTLYRQRVRIRELARVEAFRSAFIADVSHEIKTPLTGLLGAVDLLGEGAADAAVRARLLAMIAKEARRLETLVQAILDLARLERPDAAFRPVETDLAALVADVAARTGVACRNGSGEVVRAWVDPLLLEQALDNLVSNARRHAGTSDIAVWVERAGASVRVVVEDHGVGVPSDQREKIFARFHRVDPARAAESGGAGLGLSIVRQIAHLHGGEVVCEPARPQGARFVMTVASRTKLEF